AVWDWSFSCEPPDLLHPPFCFWTFDWLWSIDCVEWLLFAAIAVESALLDCFTSPPPPPQSFLPPLAMAMFGEALTATDLDSADWSIELEASCDWSFDCEPDD